MNPSSHQWPLDDQHFDVKRLWPLSTGHKVTVAVIDSGVDAQHPDLNGRVLTGADFTGQGTSGRVDISSTGHGTAVASIIAGTGNGPDGVVGLAPNAMILPVRISDDLASSPTAEAQGIAYAVDHGARVINISVCSPIANPQVRAAIADAIGKDVVVVAAAGNEGSSTNLPQYPAAFPGIVAVTATDETGHLWSDVSSGPYLGVAAPGVNIYTAGREGSRTSMTGTSFAAPQVSAVVALLRAKYPAETANQIIARLTSTAHSPSPGRSQNWGFGLIDPYAALTTPEPASSAPNPLMDPIAAAEPAVSEPQTTYWTVWVAATAVVLLTVGALAFIRRGRSAESKGRPQPRR
ncbi:type VII secretion-associated serine protease mycosin [Actinoplanes oblitus]|uniref:Type VII secretion-associated serine protease mycosin n=1 Tax=Actinoplanes oblitus TaxID=3040509 RepID=A0ABY8WMC6_9ACTN|nr:type VII secretion-associated serine protease mycosin [Actinoplanes oblitus]WIM99051.1 type VII secretion-associated serine protease mycosin [Actinoplanes oblitus]